MSKKKKSWSTTISGVLAGLAAISYLAMSWYTTKQAPTIQEWIAAIGAAALGFGLIKARDDNVSSEGHRAQKDRVKTSNLPLAALLVLPVAMATGCAGLSDSVRYQLISDSYSSAVNLSADLGAVGIISKVDMVNINTIRKKANESIDNMELALLSGDAIKFNFYFKEAQRYFKQLVEIRIKAEQERKSRADGNFRSNRTDERIDRHGLQSGSRDRKS